MKHLNILSLAIALLTLSSCAKDIVTNYQKSDDSTGTLVLRPSKSTDQTSVTLNNDLVINDENVETVKIKNIPSGEHSVHYTSESSSYKSPLDYRDTFMVEKDEKVTKLIQVPPYSTGYYIYNAILGILPLTPLLVL